MTVYHVVTDRPMELGQVILFDEAHHSGVYRRVMDKMEQVREVYAHPERYEGAALDHHLAVALRELALEEVRRERYPQYPSRMACLYVSETLREAEDWGKFFAEIGRPTYSIVKLEIEGNCFAGDATKCFDGTSDHGENLRLAALYWENDPAYCPEGRPIKEMLVDGRITVAEIAREINANLPEGKGNYVN